MTTNEIANELLNIMFAKYEEAADITSLSFEEATASFPNEKEGKINSALYMLEGDGFTQVCDADNVAYTSMLTTNAISYMEKCPLSTDGKRITKYIEPESKPAPTDSTFIIANANNSIIGTQQNATINISSSLDEIRKLIHEQATPEDAPAMNELVDTIGKNKRFSIKDIPEKILGLLNKYPVILQSIITVIAARCTR